MYGQWNISEINTHLKLNNFYAEEISVSLWDQNLRTKLKLNIY